MNKNKILFIHIPKTAGTSFRLASKDYFKEDNTYFDYSLNSVETSEIIKQKIYTENDFFSLKQYFDKKEELFLSGHYNVKKYMHIFDTTSIITFVRNPIDQVISHYKHYVRHHKYKRSIEKFILEPRFKNIQSKVLSGKRLQDYGCIGITELYDESLELINNLYDINIKYLKANVDTQKKYNFKVSDELINLIKKENELDITLYEECKQIFFNRLEQIKNKSKIISYTIQESNEKNIKGYAYFVNPSYSNQPVDIVVTQNGEEILKTKAKDFRLGIHSHNFPRNSYIGFELNISAYNFTNVNFNLNNEKLYIELRNNFIQ